MSRPPLLRPTLLPGVPRVWRGPRTVQIGLDPARAVLIDLPDPGTARILDLLDGTHAERVVLVRAAELGVPPAETVALLDALHAAGLMLAGPSLLPRGLPDSTRRRLTPEATALALDRDDAPVSSSPRAPRPSPAQALRRRGSARVVVAGRGRLAAPIAVALAEAGVGHVDPDLRGPVT
jgi:hypothetical protein